MKSIYNIYESITEGILSGMEDTLTTGDNAAKRIENKFFINKINDTRTKDRTDLIGLSNNNEFVCIKTISLDPTWIQFFMRTNEKTICKVVELHKQTGLILPRLYRLDITQGLSDSVINDINNIDMQYIHTLYIGNQTKYTEGTPQEINIDKIKANIDNVNIAGYFSHPVKKLICTKHVNCIYVRITDASALQNLNCDTLIIDNKCISENKDIKHILHVHGYEVSYPDIIQTIIDNNPKITKLFIQNSTSSNTTRFYEVKIKNGKFVDVKKTGIGDSMMTKKYLKDYDAYHDMLKWVKSSFVEEEYLVNVIK